MTATRYESLARLGTGGMATVYVGRVQGDVSFSHLVALKRAHEHVRLDPELVDGLKREARVVSRIHHPNVVGVIDVTEDGGDVILVLDYIEGCTLSDLMRRMDTSQCPREMLRILLDTAAGLDAAHRTTDESGQPLHLVHRDVSPSNVLIGRDGVARIADFGVAKTLERTAEETATGVLKGKLAYMAPEYIERHYVDARSDLFSLGVIAWEVMTGERLFKGATELETLKRVAAQNIPPPSAYHAHLAMLDPAILRAVARQPDYRFPTAGDFARELELRARASNLVGSHIEVAKLVESAFGAELTERRRRFVSENTAPPQGEPVPPAAISHAHPPLDAPNFTQSAPAQSVTQSALLTARARFGSVVPLSVLAGVLLVATAVSTGAWIAHRVKGNARPPAAAVHTVATVPPIPATAQSAAETYPSTAQETTTFGSTSDEVPSAPSASASASAKPPGKPEPRTLPPRRPGKTESAPPSPPSPPTPRIIPAKPPPNPYGP
ncbi:protein kinase [Pendulispora rubella]|uniref:Protein kinase n=1 Tax=Pendulispora rubella TaxID=2741070 RepID=A0ABZ2LH72_9BACT